MAVHDEPSDAEALRHLARAPDAICTLYDRYLPALVAALARAGGDREVAFELAQEAFATLLEKGHRIRIPPDGSVWPWLWSVARNLLRDQQRRGAVDASARRRLQIAAAEYDADVIDRVIARVDAEGLALPLDEALDELPSAQRQAIAGKVVLGLSYAELSEALDVSEQVMRTRVSRGLRALRARLSGGKQ